MLFDYKYFIIIGTLGLLRSHALDLVGCMHLSLGIFRSNIIEKNVWTRIFHDASPLNRQD